MSRIHALRRRSELALTSAAILLFTAYAGSFFYFFVDDEAIPLVYARNLLRGRGLTYTILEGRTEGYSDFLHVIWSAALLAVTQAAHFSPLAPLIIGKGVSLAAGVATIAFTAWFLRRQGASPAALGAALALLALAGPFAVWACSSLETVVFACLVMAFTATLFADLMLASVLLGVAVVLERIDVAVFVFVIVLAGALADRARAPRFWAAARWIALPALLFHLWRYWYFGSLLSAPMAAKVLYHFTGTAHALVKTPEVPYLLGLARLYGSPALAAAMLLVAFVASWKNPTARALTIAIVVLGLYVQLVGDWMFGWRLTVALFPILAVVVGFALDALPLTARWAFGVTLLAVSASAAYRFESLFVAAEHKPLFWSEPRRGQSVWLAPYAAVLHAAGRVMHAGDRIAYNQAGLLPYVLDVENIDDLGICSRFVAGLPSTDVYLTGVGRYSPLTDQPIVRTAHAYLLYRDVRFVIARADLLWRANGDRFPDTLLDGHFERMPVDAAGRDIIYTRSDKPAGQYRRDASWFSENVAHTTQLTYAAIGGRTLTSDRFGPELPFLREGVQGRSFSGDLEIDVHFPRGATVSALYVGRIVTPKPATLTLRLADEAGRPTLNRTVPIAAGGVTVLERFERPVQALAASLHVDVTGEDRVVLKDVRLEGQSRALREYLARELRFPPP